LVKERFAELPQRPPKPHPKRRSQTIDSSTRHEATFKPPKGIGFGGLMPSKNASRFQVFWVEPIEKQN